MEQNHYPIFAQIYDYEKKADKGLSCKLHLTSRNVTENGKEGISVIF